MFKSLSKYFSFNFCDCFCSSFIFKYYKILHSFGKFSNCLKNVIDTMMVALILQNRSRSKHLERYTFLNFRSVIRSWQHVELLLDTKSSYKIYIATRCHVHSWDFEKYLRKICNGFNGKPRSSLCNGF